MISPLNWIEAVILASREENVLYHDPFITAILAGNEPFLTKQHYIVHRKRSIIQPKYMRFW